MRKAGRSKCPADKKLLGAFLGEMDPAARERIARHVADCPLCRRKRAVLADIAGELRARTGSLPDSLGPEEASALRAMAGTEVRRLRGKRRPRRAPGSLTARFVIAAAILVMASAGVFFFSRTRPKDVERGAPTGIRLIEPAGSLERAPAVFRWDAVGNADIYGFEVFDEELRSIITRGTKSTSVTLSPEEAGRLVPGRSYYWDVEAFDDEGRLISSGQRFFTVAPDGAP